MHENEFKHYYQNIKYITYLTDLITTPNREQYGPFRKKYGCNA